jgi:serine/threonine-protein kinase
LGNPHLVQVHDFNTLHDGTPYLVMELLEGEDLGQRLRSRRTLPLHEMLEVLRQVADGLSAVHAEGIVHRDLKPENIFLSKGAGGSEVVKLIDFGTSKKRGAAKLTADLTAVGTPWYMSPEQALASPDVDGRSDQYALAAVCFEMLAGRPPFEGASGIEVMKKIVYAPPPELRALVPAAPAALEAVLDRALSKAPGDRFADVLAFSRAVEEALRTPRGGPPPGGKPFSVPAFGIGIGLAVAAGAHLLLGLR